MNESLGDTGLILNDPLLWEKGKGGDADSPFLGVTLNQLLLEKISLAKAQTFQI